MSVQGVQEFDGHLGGALELFHYEGQILTILVKLKRDGLLVLSALQAGRGDAAEATVPIIKKHMQVFKLIALTLDHRKAL